MVEPPTSCDADQEHVRIDRIDRIKEEYTQRVLEQYCSIVELNFSALPGKYHPIFPTINTP